MKRKEQRLIGKYLETSRIRWESARVGWLVRSLFRVVAKGTRICWTRTNLIGVPNVIMLNTLVKRCLCMRIKKPFMSLVMRKRHPNWPCFVPNIKQTETIMATLIFWTGLKQKGCHRKCWGQAKETYTNLGNKLRAIFGVSRGSLCLCSYPRWFSWTCLCRG